MNFYNVKEIMNAKYNKFLNKFKSLNIIFCLYTVNGTLLAIKAPASLSYFNFKLWCVFGVLSKNFIFWCAIQPVF